MPGETSVSTSSAPPSPTVAKPDSPSNFSAMSDDGYMPVGCYGNPHSTFKVPSETISELVKSLHLTEPRLAPAIGQLTIAFSLFVANVALLVYLPWFLTPLAWALAGVTLSNLFVIAHDCVHNNFTSSKLFNRIVGELCMLPLGQPFAAYKQRHLKQYKQKSRKSFNMTEQPVSEGESATEDEGETGNDYDPGLAEIPPPMFNALKWVRDTYRPKTTKKTRRSVAQSQALVFSFLTVMIPSLLYIGGVRAVLKYWLLPLFAYKLTYRSYFTVLTNNLNAFIPSDVNTHVASYNFTKLASTLQTKYGDVNTSLVTLIKHYAKRIHWVNVSILFGTPLISAYGVYTTGLTWQTAIWTLIYYFWSGLGITAGYHRLWAHRAYDASFPVKIFLLLGGSAALEGSLKWWAGGHRVHHRYTDTNKDPYNSKGGFWYAHMGWMLVHPLPENKAYADIRDLNADPLIRFQHKYYLLFGPTMAFLFPALVAHFGWNDFWGGFFYAGYLRLVFVHHNTFCVNSVAHYFGEQTFDDERTPRDNWVNALLTFGEGYHNFHHEFPNDYRNGLKWYDYDPTKWLIAGFSAMGLTYNLKEFNDNAIRMGKIHMMDKHANELKKKVTMPPSIDSLPTMSWIEFREKCSKGGGMEKLSVIDGIVHDIAPFIDDHPGGGAFIKSSIGVDATEKFNGSTGIYRHSNAARNVLAGFRVARLEGEEAQQKEEIAEHEIKHGAGDKSHDVHDASDPSLKKEKEAEMDRLDAKKMS